MIIDNQIEPGTVFTLTIKADEANQRLDLYLTAQFKNYSRSFFKRLLTEGLITINGKEAKSGQILKKGEVLIVTFPKLPPVSSLKAFDTKLAVKVIAEEPNFLVIYKPAGLMVHKPNQYSEEVTLVDWLLASYKNLQGIGLSERPGIVHRLDKDT